MPNFSHFHGYFDLLFAALSGYSVVFISVERWFSVWKPFDKAKYVTFKTTIITVFSYTSISIIAFSWFPFILSYSPEKFDIGESCQLTQPMLYKILGTISVIFTYIGKRRDLSFFLICFSFFSPFYFSWYTQYSDCLSFTCPATYIDSTFNDNSSEYTC
jgi:hypothetical protein